MQRQPDKHIVYRSQAEAVADEFWWSEGYLTPTKAGDGMVLFVLLACGIVTGMRLYAHFTDRFSRMSVPRVFIAASLFGLSATMFFKYGYHFIK